MQVLEHFNKALKADKARPQIAQLTELGLVELTRKRQGQNVYELFGQTCPTCGGLGHILHLPGETENRVTPAGEIPERFVSSVPQPREPREQREQREQREPRLPIARLSEPREAYEPFTEGLDPDSELAPLNLINHPSYNELGDNKRRVRRRNSNRIGINGGKDESPRIPNPLALVNEPDDMDIEADILPVSDIPSPTIGRVGWGERTERDRSRSPKVEPVKPVVEPPEIVSVEMPHQEQDVYALMGISPLIKLNREVKNPKSVIINVTAPGQSSANEVEVTPEPTVVETRSLINPKPAIEPEPEPETETEIETERQTELELELELEIETPVETPIETFDVLETSEEVAEKVVDEQPENSSTPTPERRTRKRSSARNT